MTSQTAALCWSLIISQCCVLKPSHKTELELRIQFIINSTDLTLTQAVHYRNTDSQQQWPPSERTISSSDLHPLPHSTVYSQGPPLYWWLYQSWKGQLHTPNLHPHQPRWQNQLQRQFILLTPSCGWGRAESTETVGDSFFVQLWSVKVIFTVIDSPFYFHAFIYYKSMLGRGVRLIQTKRFVILFSFCSFITPLKCYKG